MGYDTALAEEAPLTWRTLPIWALFTVIFVVTTLVGAAFVAAANLLSWLKSLSATGAVRRSGPGRGWIRPAAVSRPTPV